MAEELSEISAVATGMSIHTVTAEGVAYDDEPEFAPHDSGTDGDGDVKLASTNLYLGGDARMVSAILG